MNEILIPVLVFAGIGLVLGGMLAIAAKLFSVDTDPRIDEISECLPGANCGGCGYAGCSACAEAIVKGEAPIDACPGIPKEMLNKIGEIMGQVAQEKEPVCAVVKCSGSIDKANYKYFFDGSKTCNDVYALQGGDKVCAYACLGYGDCMAVCKFNAITLQNGVAVIDRNLCIGCGMCQKTCPKHVIDIIPKFQKVEVLCSSPDKGAAMKATCSAGCIGCKMCEKACEQGAIAVTDNLAHIDAKKCTGCGACVEKCPKKVIYVQGEVN